MAHDFDTIIEYILTVEDAFLGRMTTIGSQLEARGFRDFQLLESTGLVTVKCDSSRKDELLSISGVRSVESSDTVAIAPPESDVQ